jgi:hypothetical protein
MTIEYKPFCPVEILPLRAPDFSLRLCVKYLRFTQRRKEKSGAREGMP